MRRVCGLLAWDAAIVGAIAFLVQLPLSVGTWQYDPTLSLFAAVRLIAMIWLGLLGLKTTACAAAAAVGLPRRLVSTLARGLPGPVARAALATAGLTLAVPIAPAGAAGAAPVMRKLPEETPVTAAVPAADESRDAPPDPPPVAAVSTPAEVAPGQHVVRPGENLWVIAEGLARQSLGREATDAEVLPAWQRLIAANAQRVADPDLIHPGDVLLLPT